MHVGEGRHNSTLDYLVRLREEHVEKGRPETCGIAPSGHVPVTKDTVKGKESTSKITWANIVRGQTVGVKEETLRRSKNVSSALSRNNPVS